MPATISFPATAAGLNQLIAALEPLAGQTLAMAQERQGQRFHEAYVQQEKYIAQLLARLAAGEQSSLTPEQRAALQRVLALREQTQQCLADWADKVKHDLVALAQNSRLVKQYQP